MIDRSGNRLGKALAAVSRRNTAASGLRATGFRRLIAALGWPRRSVVGR